MKRHDNLVPISQEHHQMLLLARLLRNDAPPYKGLPLDKSEKVTYAQDQFEDLIDEHFKKEEKLYEWVLRQEDNELVKMTDELQEDHNSLRKQFERLSTASMDKLGRDLEKHVRKEEREYFQKIQEKLPVDDFLAFTE